MDDIELSYIFEKVPVYSLRGETVVLDGDIYRLFNYSKLSDFRKRIKTMEANKKGIHFFRLNGFEKYQLKMGNSNISFLKTSSHAFAFSAGSLTDKLE